MPKRFALYVFASIKYFIFFVRLEKEETVVILRQITAQLRKILLFAIIIIKI